MIMTHEEERVHYLQIVYERFLSNDQTIVVPLISSCGIYYDIDILKDFTDKNRPFEARVDGTHYSKPFIMHWIDKGALLVSDVSRFCSKNHIFLNLVVPNKEHELYKKFILERI